MGRILGSKPIVEPKFASTMIEIWKMRKRVHISDEGDRRWVFKFKQPIDAFYVRDKDPWFYKKSLIILHSYMDLDWVTFWVEIKGFPKRFQNSEATQLQRVAL